MIGLASACTRTNLYTHKPHKSVLLDLGVFGSSDRMIFGVLLQVVHNFINGNMLMLCCHIMICHLFNCCPQAITDSFATA